MNSSLFISTLAPPTGVFIIILKLPGGVSPAKEGFLAARILIYTVVPGGMRVVTWILMRLGARQDEVEREPLGMAEQVAGGLEDPKWL